ncbi:MAG: hypothetical protein ACRDZM_05450 [Acidimicrobiia bacterium]
MSRWSLVGAWVVVAALATLVTWQIVSAADAQVSERPMEALDVGAVVSTDRSTTSTLVRTTSREGIDPTTTTTSNEATTTTTPDATTPTSADTTTAPSASPQVRIITTGGGTVVVSYEPGEVVLQTAAPAPGFTADIKKQGPPDVDVEFESESSKFRVEADWDGQLIVEIDSDVD